MARQFLCRQPCRNFQTTARLALPKATFTDIQRKLVNQLDTTSNVDANREMVGLNDSAHLMRSLDRLRVVPNDTSFYMANPPHEETMRKLNALLRTYINLPIVSREETEHIAWITFQKYASNHGGTRLKPVQYKSLIRVLNRLASIDPQLIPSEVWSAITPFIRDRTASSTSIGLKSLDEFGRAVAVGRRKTSSARVFVTKNTDTAQGQILVNNKPITEFFPKMADRESILFPLKVADLVGQFNIFATVQGGGTTGQSGAVALGIARGLVIHNPLLKARLHRAGCMTRDSRMVERKKPGKPKARKSYTWVKR